MSNTPECWCDPETEGTNPSCPQHGTSWSPIDSAPRDGTEILLGWWLKPDRGDYFAQTVGSFRSGHWRLSEPGLHAADDQLDDEPEWWAVIPDPPNSHVDPPEGSDPTPSSKP